MKIRNLDEWDKWQENKSVNKDEDYIIVPREKRKPRPLDCTCYRLELDILPAKQEVIKYFNRVVRFTSYQIKKKYPECVAIIGYSEHKKWTPYKWQTSKKGGKPYKVYCSDLRYKTKPHIHFYVSGKGARQIVGRLHKNYVSYIKRKNTKTDISFRKVVHSQSCLPIGYVENQSTYCRKIGNIESFMEQHQL